MSRATKTILREVERARDQKERRTARFGCGLLLALPLGYGAAVRTGAYALRHHLDVNLWSAAAAIATVVVIVVVATFGSDRDLIDRIRDHE